jgi:hypothetical protein
VRGRRRRRCCENCLPNTFDISEHVIVPEAKNAIPVIDKPSVARGITLVIGVLTAVDFDDESLLAANKVGDVGPDRLLANELESTQPP